MDLPDYFERRTALFLTAGVLIGITATLILTSLPVENGQNSAQNLVDTLEKSTGKDLKLMSVEKEHGLFETRIKDQNETYSYYISEDSKLVIPGSEAMDFERFTRRVDAQRNFTTCLNEKNLVMYGNLSQDETKVQIEVLGGLNHISGIYVDVNNQENLEEALQRGVKKVPAFYMDGSLEQGVQLIENLENFTGCQYSLN